MEFRFFGSNLGEEIQIEFHFTSPSFGFHELRKGGLKMFPSISRTRRGTGDDTFCGTC